MAARGHVFRQGRWSLQVQRTANPRSCFILSTFTAVCISIVLSCTCSSAEEVCDSSCGSLGPAVGSATDQCTGDQCPDVGSNEGHGGFEMTSTEEAPSMLSNIGSSVTGAFSSATDFVSRNIYNKAANVTQEFAEKVREVVHEELYGFVESLAMRSWNLLLSPDTLLGVVLQTYGRHALSLSLVVLVLLTDYILLQFFSFLSVLSLDCSLLLLHRVFGPQWIYSKLFVVLQYLYSFLRLLVRHPYISAVLVVLLFILTIAVPIVRWTTRRKVKDKINTIEERALHTAHEVDTVGKVVKEMNQRVQRIEEKQEEMLRLLRELTDRRT